MGAVGYWAMGGFILGLEKTSQFQGPGLSPKGRRSEEIDSGKVGGKERGPAGEPERALGAGTAADSPPARPPSPAPSQEPRC